MEIKPKLYKLIKRFITQSTKGSDVFMHNGSRWIIFVEDKKWVIELTKEGTLWYNYYFFQNIFELVDLDVVENQHYITKWVEDNVINGVKEARPMEEWVNSEKIVDKTIQNGVKYTIDTTHHKNKLVEDTIQNGVKKTVPLGIDKDSIVSNDFGMNEAIQNGVKKTYSDKIPHEYDWSNQFTEEIDDIIQNGVKHTEKSLQIDGSCVIEDVIKEGAKHTEYGDWLDGDERFDDVIRDGVKETWGYEKQSQDRINEVIENGIKENPS